MRRTMTIGVAVLLLAEVAAAQRVEWPAEEFAERRQRLCERLEDGVVLLLGDTMPQPGVGFRQDNDFFYLTGVEDLNAGLLLDVATCGARLYLPRQSDREVRGDGPNLLTRGTDPEDLGLAAVHPVGELEEHLARLRGEIPRLWVRLGEADAVDRSRGDTALYLGRRFATSFGGQPSENAWRVATLRSRYPDLPLADLTPHLDRLRMVKSPREIEVLRTNGRLSAEGIRRAIAITRPGRHEYELEAEARYHFTRHGAEGVAYPAIVASGPNLAVWHYFANDRQLEDGDVVVMDFGADLGGLTMDITRTWPVAGAFDERAEKAYRCVLEAQEAIIAAMRPGVTREELVEVNRRVNERHGFGDQPAYGAGHFVGMATHDVGLYDVPLEAGMVIAVEPILAFDDGPLHVRIEDTVLVTEDGAEVLNPGVPKALEEVLALVGTALPAGEAAATR